MPKKFSKILVAGSEDTHCDLSAVRYQDLGKLFRHSFLLFLDKTR